MAQRSALAHADSLAVAGDSTAALAALDSLIQREPSNAAAWNRRGMLAWSMARSRRRHFGPMEQRDISLLRIADTSLRLAARYAPDSARFSVDLGRHFLWAELPQLRLQAPRRFDAALDAARRAGDSTLIAEAADEVGMVHWRRYEALAHRRMLVNMARVDPQQYLHDPRSIPQLLTNFSLPISPPPGEIEYQQAVEHFLAAAAASPSNQRPLAHSLMALAEKQLWPEMRRRADVVLASMPWISAAWLARGVASHWMGDDRDAALAFDSALLLLPADQRARYTNLARILRPADSARYAGLRGAERSETDRMYWTTADPLLLTAVNEFRVEFLARVAYAELRWTSEDLDLHGADSDRGQIWIRFGPPDSVASFSPDQNGENPAFGSLLWYYARGGLHFFFNQPPTYGTARLTLPDAAVADETRQRFPVSWGNVRVARMLDSVPVQVARFRAGDSVDVATYADLPLRSLARGADLSRAPIDVGYIVLDDQAHLMIRDSTRQLVDTAASNVVQDRAWRFRMPPGFFAFHVEALQPNSDRAARVADTLRLPVDRGFGLSDLLVARNISPRIDTPARWTDMLITPSAGRLARRQPFGVLWESYELIPRDGSVTYLVQLTLTRSDRSRLASVVARVLGGTSGPFQASASAEKVILSFTRQAAARPVLVDYLMVDPGDLPAGRYRLTLEVTDRTSGRTAHREREITFVE